MNTNTAARIPAWMSHSSASVTPSATSYARSMQTPERVHPTSRRPRSPAHTPSPSHSPSRSAARTPQRMNGCVAEPAVDDRVSSPAVSATPTSSVAPMRVRAAVSPSARPKDMGTSRLTRYRNDWMNAKYVAGLTTSSTNRETQRPVVEKNGPQARVDMGVPGCKGAKGKYLPLDSIDPIDHRLKVTSD